MQDTFSIHAKLMDAPIDSKLPSTSEQRQMQIAIIDGETGDKYELDDVTVQLSELVNPVTAASHLVVHIDHPAIKFQTKEVLIGNRLAQTFLRVDLLSSHYSSIVILGILERRLKLVNTLIQSCRQELRKKFSSV